MKEKKPDQNAIDFLKPKNTLIFIGYYSGMLGNYMITLQTTEIPKNQTVSILVFLQIDMHNN